MTFAHDQLLQQQQQAADDKLARLLADIATQN